MMKNPTRKRILFLDIDGVISSIRNAILQLGYDVTAVKLLKDLQERCGFLIVLSSARRKHFTSKEDFIKEVFEETGVTLELHDSWRTVSHPTNQLEHLPKRHQVIFKSYRKYWKKYLKTYHDTLYWRGHEIRQWLRDHGEDNYEYVVIDDSFDLFPIPVERIVHIQYGECDSGMKVEHYDRVLELFGEEEVLT